jgi:hypothetical protein
MNNNGIKKEALISTRDNPFAGSRGWSGLFSAFGKGSLAKKSESYREAIRIMEEIDDNIRAAFKKQQQFAKEAYWGKFKMDLSRFAHAVNDFFNQQVIIITLAESSPTKGNLQALMGKVPFEVYQNSKWFGKLEKAPDEPEIYTDPEFDANEFTGTLNEFNEEGALRWINHANEIIEKREGDKRRSENKPAKSQPIKSQTVENLADKASEGEPEPEAPEVQKELEETPGAEIETPKAAEVELYQELVKKGLLDSLHYKSLMRGKSLKNSMNKIFNLMQGTLDQSAGTLNIVSHAVNVGDPDEYIKEINKLVRKGNDAMVRIVPLWNEHFKSLVEQTEDKEGEPSEEDSAQEYQEVQDSDIVDAPAEEAPEGSDQVSKEEYLSGEAPPSEKDQFAAGESLIPLGKEVRPAYEKDEEEYYQKIPKYVQSGDFKGLSEYIKKYANSIDDEDLKLKLIAIAEEADE